ncbi:MAG: TIGR04086 family membrane protein [Firmicutes bacterium]|nr:TIGR04086 family membrane protein [Bacillota bacterium]
MKGSKNKELNPIFGLTLKILKAVIIAMLISLVGILIMAFVVQWLSIDTRFISIINQVIKGIAILVACFFALKKTKNGAFVGLAVGLIFIALAFVIFSLLDNNTWAVGLTLLNDVVLGAVTGFVAGIITVNIRK